MVLAVLVEKPLAVAVRMDFFEVFYDIGILTELAFETIPNHGVVVVGYHH